MNRNIKFIWHGMTYRELRDILAENPGIRSFPLLDNTGTSTSRSIRMWLTHIKNSFVTEQMILLGSVQRLELFLMISRHIGPERRIETAARRHLKAKYRLKFRS